MRKFIASLLFVLLFSPVFAQSYTLQFNLEEGKIYSQNMVSEMKMQSKFGGQNMDINLTISCQTTYRILQKTATDYLTETSFKNMKVSMAMSNGTNATFDSNATGDENPMSRVLSGLTGKTFTCRITPQGQMTEVKGLDELYKSIFDGLSSISDEQKEQISQQVQQAFGEKSVRSNFQYACVFPDHAVKPGDKWNQTTTMQAMMPVSLNAVYELKGVDADSYHIVGTATLDPNASGSENSMMPIKLSGTIQSDLKLDLKTCWLKCSTMTFKATGNMGDSTESNLSIDMTIAISE